MRSRRAWLIGYDISSPKRLRRVATWLEKHAIRLQGSLFLGVWTEKEFARVWQGVADRIDPRRDDVRAWPVSDDPRVVVIGAPLPAGVVFGDGRIGAVERILMGALGADAGRGKSGRGSVG